MSDTNTRANVVQLFIAAAICVGGYLLLVDPAHKRLTAVRAQVVEKSAKIKQLQQVRDAVPRFTQMAEQAAHQASVIEARSTPARDQGALFASLAALAAEHHVRLDTLDPYQVSRPTPPPAAPAAAGAPPAPPPPKDSVLGYTITMVGSYDDLARFVSAIQHTTGFTRIRNLRLSPITEGTVTAVHATLQTEHYAFDASAPADPAAATPGPAGATAREGPR